MTYIKIYNFSSYFVLFKHCFLILGRKKTEDIWDQSVNDVLLCDEDKQNHTLLDVSFPQLWYEELAPLACYTVPCGKELMMLRGA